MAAGKSIVVAGAGGNIGSHLVPHLGRMPQLRRAVLIDRDIYEPRNLHNQDILPRDVGGAKAEVQARRMTAIRPDIEVIPIHAPLESVPWATWRADLVVACLDSRIARQALNERAWRLGIPWVDSGVLASQCLARVNVYVPAADNPCLECAWSADDYELIEQHYPCGTDTPAAPTGASSALGALAAAMAATEIQKLLGGEFDCAAIGKQVTWNARWHRSLVTQFRRNSACRFDHAVWPVEPLRCGIGEMRLKDLIADGAASVAGQRFTRRRVCGVCGRGDVRFRLGRAAAVVCCGRAMATSGFDLVEKLDGALPPDVLEMPLAEAGLAYGDFVSIRGRFWELTPLAVMQEKK